MKLFIVPSYTYCCFNVLLLLVLLLSLLTFEGVDSASTCTSLSNDGSCSRILSGVDGNGVGNNNGTRRIQTTGTCSSQICKVSCTKVSKQGCNTRKDCCGSSYNTNIVCRKKQSGHLNKSCLLTKAS